MIQVTSAAACQMKRLLGSRHCNGWGLRIGVKGGGCSRLSYTLALEQQPGDHDRIFIIEGIRIFCDPRSYCYLDGLELDYGEELIGGGFKFNHPKMVRNGSSAAKITH